MIRVSVRDTGSGLKKKQLDIVFQQYVQLPMLSYRKPGGTGLGLAISKEIVLSHGGHIWAESETGRGTEFIFVLPLERRGKRS
ncbi:MAG: ATP-binding protein [Elusimicrobiota bacterium]|nr:ATP-binding protein [Elusimicrobiota bacterium]